MNIEFIIGGFFFFVVTVAFVAGMFLAPEVFGISRKDKTKKSDDETKI